MDRLESPADKKSKRIVTEILSKLSSQDIKNLYEIFNRYYDADCSHFGHLITDVMGSIQVERELKMTLKEHVLLAIKGGRFSMGQLIKHLNWLEQPSEIREVVRHLLDDGEIDLSIDRKLIIANRA